MANGDDNLNIRIGTDPSDIEGGSKAAAAAINKVTKEAADLDRAFKQLRSSLDPMFAAQLKYNQSLSQLDMLLGKGALSEAEYASSIDKAREALARQTAEQLRGTAVANAAAEAASQATQKKRAAEQAASAASLASSKASSTARAAEAAAVTAAEAREVKARTALALQEAKDKAAAAEKAKANVPSVNRNSQGQFISKATVEADRAAAAEEAQNMLNIAQVEDTVAGQRVRNTQRVATTREEAARRAESAEQASAEVAKAMAAEVEVADAKAAAAAQELARAQEIAAQAALKAAAEQAEADRLVSEATAAKARAAADAAISEEKAALATAKAREADAAATLEKNKAEAAARKAAQADAQRVASAERLKASLDKTYAAQMRYNQSVEMANGLAATGHIDEPTRLEAIAKAQKVLSDALNANTGHTINNRAAYESLILVHEALAHRWTRMSSSAMILGQALAGQSATAAAMTLIFSPLGAVIGGVTAALGILAYAAYEGSVEQGKLQKSLAVTSQYAGMSAAQIEEAAGKIAASTHTSASAATASMSQIAASGRVTGQTLVTMGEIVARLADLTGEKSEQIAADMVKMADDPTAAMKKLNDQYHFLTPTQAEHIRNLIEEGQKTEAVADLSGKFRDALQAEQTDLSGLAGMAHRAAVAMGDLWQSMKDIGKTGDTATQLAQVTQQLAMAQNAHPIFGGGPDTSFIAGLKKKQADLQAKIDADTTKSHKAQLDQQATDDREALNALETTTRTNHAKMLREQQAWRQEANRLLKNPEASKEDKEDAQYRLDHSKETDERVAKKYDAGDIPKKERQKHGPSEISKMQEELNAELNATKNYFADADQVELDFWDKKLAAATKGSALYISIESKRSTLLKRMAKSDYADDIAALKNKIDAAKGNLLEEGVAWSIYLAKVKSVMTETSKEYQNAEKEYRDAQQKMAETQAKMMEKKEKDSEQPVQRAQQTKQTGQELQSGTADYMHTNGMMSDKKYAEFKKALLIEQTQDEANYENVVNQMRKDSFAKQLSVEGLSAEQSKSIHEQMEAQEQQHQDKLQQIRDKGLLSYQKANEQVSDANNAVWTKTYDAMASHLTQSLNAGIAHGFNFQAAMRGMALTVLDSWVDMGAKMLTNWLKNLIFQKTATAATTAVDVTTHTAGEVAKTGATVVGTQARVAATASGAVQERSINFITTIKAIAGHAAKAAAGAYASLASVPIIGPVLGAAAAAGTFAAVLAFGAIVSAAGGQAEVPYDGQLSMLHKKEMVLPAWAAGPLRDGLKAGNSNGLFNSTASKAGDVRNSTSVGNTFNYQPTHNHQNTDLEGLLRTQGKTFKKWINNEHRNGGLKLGKA
jgi:phage-related minor tail protein